MAMRVLWNGQRLVQAGGPVRVCIASMSSSSGTGPPPAQQNPPLPAAAEKKKETPRSWLELESTGKVTSSEPKDELVHEELRSQRPLFYHDQMEWLDDRLVWISKPSKNVMQSGKVYTNTWKIEFNSQERSEYWLMGWTGTADPVSNLSLNFPTKEDAVSYCEKNQLPWYVEEQPERKIRRKSYADNYSQNKQ